MQLESLFGLQAGAKKKKTKSKENPKSRSLIDPKRAQNVGILLAQFKNLGSFEAIGEVMIFNFEVTHEYIIVY